MCESDRFVLRKERERYWLTIKYMLRWLCRKYHQKVSAKSTDKIKTHQESRKTEDTLKHQMRKLKDSAPTDNSGHWELRLLVDSQPSLATRIEVVRQASHTLNTRRALVRQEFDRQKISLDKRNVFTKEANVVRMENGLSVEIHRQHNLRNVVKDVRQNAKR